MELCCFVLSRLLQAYGGEPYVLQRRSSLPAVDLAGLMDRRFRYAGRLGPSD